jgi:hypothetical protein
VAALALAFGPYPVSLIGVPGQVVQNSSPPSVVMLAFGCAQAGVLITLAPRVSRWLERSNMQRALGSANRRVMMLYLWHMVAVVLLTIVAYPTWLFPQPVLGTAEWWWARLLWVVSLSVLTGGVLLLVGRARKLFAAGLGSVPIGLPVSWANPLLLAGVGAAALALWQISLHGFAPDGEIPWTTALLYVGGIAVAALRPQRTPSEPTSSMKGVSSTDQ